MKPVDEVRESEEQYYPEVNAAIDLYLKTKSVSNVKDILMEVLIKEGDPLKKLYGMYALVDILWVEINKRMYECQRFMPYVDMVEEYASRDKLMTGDKGRSIDESFKNAVITYAALQDDMVILLFDLKEALSQFESVVTEEDESQMMKDQIFAIQIKKDELTIGVEDFCLQSQRIKAIFRSRGKLIARKLASQSAPRGKPSEKAEKLREAVLKLGKNNSEIKQHSRDIVVSNYGEKVGHGGGGPRMPVLNLLCKQDW